MRWLLWVVLGGCGRISFEVVDPGDAAVGDGSTDSPAGDAPGDAPQVRACHSDPRYTTVGGLVNTYREGVEQVTWSVARTLCMMEDADLWVVESVTEQNAFIGDWVGVTDEVTEGVWRKLDGTIATFLPFGAGEPDGGATENCLRNDSAGFEDRDCADSRDYVCECPAP